MPSGNAGNPPPHVHQVQGGDAQGELDHLSVAILFPALGAPCVVDPAGESFVEVLLATAEAAPLSVGNVAHYLRYRPYVDRPDPQAPPEQGARTVAVDNVFISPQPWRLEDFGRGVSDLLDRRVEDLEGDRPRRASAGEIREVARHEGIDGSAVDLGHPIFPLTTCRLHAVVIEELKARHPVVFRVLLRAGAFPVGTLLELVWISRTPRTLFRDRCKAHAQGARGRMLTDAAYDELAPRHPFLVCVQPPSRFAHLTDIHNSTAHNVLNLSEWRVLERLDENRSPPIRGLLNNYNRNFTSLAERAVAAGAEAFVLTGDLVDYGRGIWYPSSDAATAGKAAWMETLHRTGDQGPPPLPAGNVADRPSKLQIWEEMGGGEQLHYAYDANFKYFIERKIEPLYRRGRPVFTGLGNHDFHPHPFTPWPTGSGSPDEDSYNPFTPSDYNLTRYEALLAYGPNCYDAYVASAIWFSMFGAENGGAGVVSTPRCCGVYFFFVNPWIDYSVRLGHSSLMMLDFGRREVRPQDKTVLFFVIGLLLALLGLALLIWGAAIESPALIIIGAILLLLGAIFMGAAVGAGVFEGSFEELGDLPAAQDALNDAQIALLDAWCGLGGLGERALFGHALVLGRAQKNISLKQFNDHPELGRRDKMKYGVYADQRDHLIDRIADRSITVSLSGHSHYTSVYRLDDGGGISAHWPADERGGDDPTDLGALAAAESVAALSGPGDQGQRLGGDRLVCVTRASGPMAEVNRLQSEPLDGDNSRTIERQLRGKPGATLLGLGGGRAEISQILCDLETSRPSRAAFDSWKNRLDSLQASAWLPRGDQVAFTLHYRSDVAPAAMADGRALWNWRITTLVFFLRDPARELRIPLLFDAGLAPGSDEPSRMRGFGDGRFAVYDYKADLPRDDFREILRALAAPRDRLFCAIEYPESGERPWIFQVTMRENSGGLSTPVYHFQRLEFPDFETRRREAESARAPTGAP